MTYSLEDLRTILEKTQQKKFNNYTTITKYDNNNYKISVMKCLSFAEKKRNDDKNINEYKLLQHLSRAKKKIVDYALCNPFEYFVTLTIDKEKYNRQNLKDYYKSFSQWLQNYNKKYNLSIKYLLIPELHSDGISWHMHGLIYGLPASHLSKNKNNYLDWLAYSVKFGYISLDKIKNNKACSYYISKYVAKGFGSKIPKNDKLYYCSRGLLLPTQIAYGVLASRIDADGEIFDFPDILPNFSNEYCCVYNVDKITADRINNMLDSSNIPKKDNKVQLDIKLPKEY